jgi:hypothetical protein
MAGTPGDSANNVYYRGDGSHNINGPLGHRRRVNVAYWVAYWAKRVT